MEIRNTSWIELYTHDMPIMQEDIDRCNIVPGEIYVAWRREDNQRFVARFRVVERDSDYYPGQFCVEMDGNTHECLEAQGEAALQIIKYLSSKQEA